MLSQSVRANVVFGAGARGLKVVDILILGDYSLVVSFVFSAPFMR